MYSNTALQKGTAARLALAGLTALVAVIAGCSAGSNNSTAVIYGPPTGISGGIARTYVAVDSVDKPQAIGVSLQLHALDNPDDVTTYPNEKPYALILPVNAPSIPFHSVTFFSSTGQGPNFGSVPGPYDVPHYNVSFSLETQQQRSAIGASLVGISSYPSLTTDQLADPNFNTPDVSESNPTYKPFVPISPTGSYYTNYSDSSFTVTNPSTNKPVGEEIPSLGTDLYDPNTTALNGNAFTIESQWDFFAGNLTAITLSAARNQLVAADVNGSSVVETPAAINKTVQLALPASYQKTGYYPTTYTISYDAGSKTYKFELGSLVYRQGVDGIAAIKRN